jgi:hypothetical protein
MVSEAFGSNSEDNSQDDKKLQQQNAPAATNAGPQALAGSQQGKVASFSSGQTPAQGSGRFTNTQKYLDANTQASGNLGAKANKELGREFGKQQQDVTQKNQALQGAFQKGQQDLQTGQGFQSQLGEIQQGLQKGFQDFGNREGFDAAGQQAQALAQNQDYGRIASGQAIDETGLTTQQQAALQGSQGLLGTAQKNLQGIQTEQGRDTLFSQVLQPKQGYTSGQRSFDKLFLGGALGGIKQNLQGQQATANQLLQGTQAQDKTLQDLISEESSLTSGISDAAKASQDIFDTTFGSQANIDYVNNLRNERFNSLKSALTSGGSISQEDMNALGLNSIGSTFINENSPLGKGGELIGTYNLLKDPNAVNNYISQGALAQNTKDITTQKDLDSYKALQALALGRDTGKLTGVSELGSSYNVVKDLGKDISEQDKAFRDTYGNNTYRSAYGNYGDEYRDNFFKFAPFGNMNSSVTTTPSNVQDYLNTYADATKTNIDFFRRNGMLGIGKSYEPESRNLVDQGATAVAQSNLADYLRGHNIQTASTNLYNDAIAGDYIKNTTQNQATENVKNRLENVLSTEGVRNAIKTGENKNYKRFGGLV